MNRQSILEKKDVANDYNKLLLRIKHGVKKELLFLVQLKGIGRVRARLLWHNKVRTIADLKKISDRALAEIIGPNIAKQIKEEIRD